MPIVIRTGGGGGGLNVKVVAYSVTPTGVAAENTIAVVTDTAITGWVMQAEEPTGESGLVWIKVDSKSTAPIWADKKQTVLLYPVKALQYINDAWVDIDAYVYQNSEWVELSLPFLILYDNGYENPIAGEIVEDSYAGTKYDTYIFVRITGTGEGRVYTANKIDVTEYKTLHAIVSPGGALTINLGLRDTTTGSYSTKVSEAFSSQVAGVQHELKLSLEDVTGEFYIVAMSTSTSVGWNFYKLWLE